MELSFIFLYICGEKNAFHSFFRRPADIIRCLNVSVYLGFFFFSFFTHTCKEKNKGMPLGSFIPPRHPVGVGVCLQSGSEDWLCGPVLTTVPECDWLCRVYAIENLSTASGVMGSSHLQICFLLYSETHKNLFFTLGKWGVGMSIKQLCLFPLVAFFKGLSPEIHMTAFLKALTKLKKFWLCKRNNDFKSILIDTFRYVCSYSQSWQ